MIYILTVYDSLNYGSYLQAISLQHELKQYGDVRFVDIKHQSTFQQCLKKVAAHIAKKRFNGIKFEFVKWKIFRNLLRTTPLISNDEIVADMGDIYVFGSDEIWNISRKKFLKSPEFWGVNLKKGRKISYAPSINSATKEEYEKHIELIRAINKFDSVSVRDKHSYSVLSELIDKPIEIVLDPTFLYGVDNFKKIEKKPEEKESYVLIYTYGKMCRTAEQIESIKSFAKNKNLKLISVGKYLNWVDESINATPEEFLGYVDSASYIITDTFHGTVFSILYRKNFIDINPANKIKDLLNLFNLNTCIISDASKLEGMTGFEIDYSAVNVIQHKHVESSRMFLKNSIKNTDIEG